MWLATRGKGLPIANHGVSQSIITDEADPPIAFEAQPRDHSRKPNEAYTAQERLYGEVRRLELFARPVRPGWTAWGNEIRHRDPQREGLTSDDYGEREKTKPRISDDVRQCGGTLALYLTENGRKISNRLSPPRESGGPEPGPGLTRGPVLGSRPPAPGTARGACRPGALPREWRVVSGRT
jgi:hypothetical protein